MKWIWIFAALAISANLSACGTKGSLKTPAQMEHEKAKKAKKEQEQREKEKAAETQKETVPEEK